MTWPAHILFLWLINISVVKAAPSQKCLPANLNVLWSGVKTPVDGARVHQGRLLSGDLSETILKNAGKNSDHIFASLNDLSVEDLKIFKEELQSGTWKWTCE